MNNNLSRLKELVTETNQVVANLKNEVKEIEEDNQILRAKKFEEIRDYLLDCSEIVKELGVTIRVPIKANVKYLQYPTKTYIEFLHFTNKHEKPISFFYECTDRNHHEFYERNNSYGFDSETMWKSENEKQYFFGCWWKDKDEKAFVDEWNQDKFEKNFAACIEEAIKEKAKRTNDEYEYVTNNTKLLKEN